MQLGGGGWSWVEVGARISNTQKYKQLSGLSYATSCLSKKLGVLQYGWFQVVLGSFWEVSGAFS